MAAKAAGVQALDTVFIDLADKEGLINDSKLAKQLGFKGKFKIVFVIKVNSTSKIILCC